MPDSTITAQPTPDSASAANLHAGMRIPFFEPGSRDTPLSARHMNMIIGLANALANLKVRRVPAPADSTGMVNPGADFKLGDQNAELILYDAPGGSGEFMNNEQTYTASCPGGSVGDDVTATVLGGTLSAESQSAADALALELATDRALLALVCTPTATTGFDDTVWRIALRTNGTLAVAGEFTYYGGIYRPAVAVLFDDLSLHVACWDVNYNGGVSGFRYDVLPSGSLEMVLRGPFTGVYEGIYNSNNNSGIARLNNYGFINNTFNSGTGFNGGVSAFVFGACPVVEDGLGRLFVSDNSPDHKYNGADIPGLICLNSAGTFVFNFAFTDAAGTLLPGYPYIARLRLDSDYKIYCLGSFVYSDGGGGYVSGKYDGNSLADNLNFMTINPDFTFGSFREDAGGFVAIGDPVSGFAIQHRTTSKDLIFVGQFTSYGGVAMAHICRTDNDGALDVDFNPALTVTGGIFREVEVDGNDRILVCGDFTGINSAARAGIIRLEEDGTMDSTFTGPTSINGSVWTVALDASGNIFIGGDFTTINGVVRNRIAKLDPNGNLL